MFRCTLKNSHRDKGILGVATFVSSSAAVAGQAGSAFLGFKVGAGIGAFFGPLAPIAVPVLSGLGAAAGAIGFDVFGADDVVKGTIKGEILDLQRKP